MIWSRSSFFLSFSKAILATTTSGVADAHKRAKIPPKLGQGFEGEAPLLLTKIPIQELFWEFSVTQWGLLLHYHTTQGMKSSKVVCSLGGQKPFRSSSMWVGIVPSKTCQKLIKNGHSHIRTQLSQFWYYEFKRVFISELLVYRRCR